MDTSAGQLQDLATARVATRPLRSRLRPHRLRRPRDAGTSFVLAS